MKKQDRLKEIKDRCDKATGGPWVKIFEHHKTGRDLLKWIVPVKGTRQTNDDDHLHYDNCEGDIITETDYMSDIDAEFICTARTDIPMLLEMVEYLKFSFPKDGTVQKSLEHIMEKYK